MKKVVFFGGGGIRNIVKAFKKYHFQIATVASMVDNGGSTGVLRKKFSILPPGDIRRHILALSSAPGWKKDIWEDRIGEETFPGGHKGHSFGNIFLAISEFVLKDYRKVLKTASDFMNLELTAKVLPATTRKTHLVAVLENGEIIFGEDEIDIPKKHDPKLRIKKVFLKPRAKIFSETKKVIDKANVLIFGPGDLYSSIIACFLPEGMKEAISASNAKKVFISPFLTKIGETQGFTILDLTKEIERYIGTELDFVIYNNKKPSRQRLKKYLKKNPYFVNIVKINKNLPPGKFIGENILLNKGPIECNPKKISKLLKNIING